MNTFFFRLLHKNPLLSTEIKRGDEKTALLPLRVYEAEEDLVISAYSSRYNLSMLSISLHHDERVSARTSNTLILPIHQHEHALQAYKARRTQ